MFADDLKLFRTIRAVSDCLLLQDDINSLVQKKFPPIKHKKMLRSSFLYPPHRTYISFVNTFVTHKNKNLRPYVPWRHLISEILRHLSYVCLSVRSNHDCVRTQRATNFKIGILGHMDHLIQTKFHI